MGRVIGGAMLAAWLAVGAPGPARAQVIDLTGVARSLVQVTLLSVRSVVDLSYASVTANGRTGEVAVNGIVVGKGDQSVRIDRIVLARNGGEVQGARVDLGAIGIPPEAVEIAEALHQRQIRLDAVTDYDLDLTTGRLGFTALVDVRNGGSLSVAVAVENLRLASPPTADSLASGLNQEVTGDLVSLEIAYDDRGLADAAVALAAKMQGMPPEAARESLPAMLAAGLQSGLQQDPARPLDPAAARLVADVAGAVQRFIAKPGHIEVSVRPAHPIPFADLQELLESGRLAALNISAATEPSGLARLRDTASLAKAASVPVPPGGPSAGNAALVALGKRYLTGDGVPQDFAKARDYLGRGAAPGDATAHYLLARSLAVRPRGSADLDDAYMHAAIALAAGMGEAAELVDRIEGGIQPERLDAVQAKTLAAWRALPPSGEGPALAAAAEAGDPTAMRNLARAYMSGLGLPRDYVEAYAWANLAAAAGDVLAARLRDRLVDGVVAGRLPPALVERGQALAAERWQAGLGAKLASRGG